MYSVLLIMAIFAILKASGVLKCSWWWILLVPLLALGVIAALGIIFVWLGIALGSVLLALFGVCLFLLP